MFSIPPFIIACALIVVGYYFFSVVYIQRVKAVFIKHLTDAALMNLRMKEGLFLSHSAFMLYVSKHHDPDFLSPQNFTADELRFLKAILEVKL